MTTPAEAADPPPTPWADPAPGRPLPLWRSLSADLSAHAAPWSPGFRATLLHRLAHAARPRLGPLGKASAAALFWAIRHGYGCAIAPTSRIHGGLTLPHPRGIVIGGGAEIGPGAVVHQNVTIGGSPGKPGLPRIGAGARIHPGAVVSGPVRLGDGVTIGANAVVARDLPDRSIVRPPVAEAAPIPAP